METFIASIFIIWFCLTIIWQFQYPFVNNLREIDILGLIPNWTFFAPNPGTSDFHIIYRLASKEQVCEWVELPMTANRKAFNSLWNPEKRRTKMLIDCVNSIIQLVKATRKNSDDEQVSSKLLTVSVPYMLILNTVQSDIEKSGFNGFSHVQFAVVESFGFVRTSDPKPVLYSGYHSII